MDDREESCAAAILPSGWAEKLADYRWSRDLVGEAGASVYRLHGRAGYSDLYLKQGSGSVADDVTDEMARLLWLSRHLPVPQVEAFAREGNQAWLLMAAMPGRTAWQIMDAHPDRRVAVVDALAMFLRRLHAIPPETCPFVSDHRHRLTLARTRIDANLVEEEDFDEERQGWSAQQVWDAMQALLPLDPDPVVTHGDYSLDNILMMDGQVTGCIDAGASASPTVIRTSPSSGIASANSTPPCRTAFWQPTASRPSTRANSIFT